MMKEEVKRTGKPLEQLEQLAKEFVRPIAPRW